MTARTHDLAAFTALSFVGIFAALPNLTLGTVLVAILANQLGGIAPDIDQPTAPIWRNLPEGHVIGKAFGKLLGGHRFISHSILGIVLFGFLSHLLLQVVHPIMPHINTQIVWYAFLIGFISHLLMDTITKEGVPWLLPIPIKFGLPPVKSFRITTGKSVEALVVFPGLILITIWLYATKYNYVTTFIHGHIIH